MARIQTVVVEYHDGDWWVLHNNGEIDVVSTPEQALKNIQRRASRGNKTVTITKDLVARHPAGVRAAEGGAVTSLPRTKRTKSGLTLYLSFDAQGRPVYVSVPEDETCPECGNVLDVNTDVTTYEPRTNTYSTAPAVAFCNQCPWAHEV